MSDNLIPNAQETIMSGRSQRVKTMPKQTLTMIEAIDKIIENLDSLDVDSIAHLYELVFGGHATGIDGGIQWEENDNMSEGR